MPLFCFSTWLKVFYVSDPPGPPSAVFLQRIYQKPLGLLFIFVPVGGGLGWWLASFSMSTAPPDGSENPVKDWTHSKKNNRKKPRAGPRTCRGTLLRGGGGERNRNTSVMGCRPKTKVGPECLATSLK